MSSQLDPLEALSIPLPIPQTDRQLAQSFADEQVTPEKARQVYRNTLAVLAVNRYLNMQGFDTDLKQSDCFQPVLRRSSDVADLHIPALGKLECIPVSASATNLDIPPEAQHARLGYLAVQLDEETSKAILLGFARVTNPEDSGFTLEWSVLKSMDDLMVFLCDLERGIEVWQEAWSEATLPVAGQGLLLAQLWDICQTQPTHRWGRKGEEVLFGTANEADSQNLSEGLAAMSRELGSAAPHQNLARREFVETLLENLADAWNMES